jgi:hypothetical protein
LKAGETAKVQTMQEPGLDRHEWQTEWEAVEEQLRDEPREALPEVDRLVERLALCTSTCSRTAPPRKPRPSHIRHTFVTIGASFLATLAAGRRPPGPSGKEARRCPF